MKYADRQICMPSPLCIRFIHFVEQIHKRVCSSMFPSSHLVCCLFHVQGAILTTMLATRNFSSKYDGHGKYLRTPRTKKNGRNNLFVRKSYGMAWSLPFTRNLCFCYSPFFMLNLYPVMCFIPEHASWYIFWSDSFTLLHDMMVEVVFHYAELTYWKSVFYCSVLMWRMYCIMQV